MVLNPWNCLSHVVGCGTENHDQIGITVSQLEVNFVTVDELNSSVLRYPTLSYIVN